MVTHLSIVHGFSCLTSVIWPFTLTALTFGSCWFGIVSHFKDGWALNFFHKLKCLNVWNLHNALVSDKTFWSMWNNFIPHSINQCSDYWYQKVAQKSPPDYPTYIPPPHHPCTVLKRFILTACVVFIYDKICSDHQHWNLQEVFSTSFNLKQEAFIRRDEERPEEGWYL